MDARERFAQLLAGATREWRSELDRRLRPLGLSQSRWMTLLTLSMAGGPMAQKELAQRLSIEAPTLVGLLDRLARDGLVSREESVDDRRRNLVRLTEAGQEQIAPVRRVARQLRNELMADIDDTELAVAMGVLAKLRAKLGAQD